LLVEDASVHGIKPLLHSLLRRRLWRRGGQPQRKKENGVEAAGQNQNHALFDNRYSAVNISNNAFKLGVAHNRRQHRNFGRR
jgi:hypothetical protein